LAFLFHKPTPKFQPLIVSIRKLTPVCFVAFLLKSILDVESKLFKNKVLPDQKRRINFMFKKVFIVFFLVLLIFDLKAQFPNPLDFNTATNATNTGTIPVGSNDLHWTASLTSSVGPYVPAVSCGVIPGWLISSYPNANWITYPHACSAGPAEHACLGNTDEFYKLTFNLPALACGQSVSTPGAYCLSLDFYADNWVHEIFVNGISSFFNPTGSPYNSWGFTGAGVKVSLCNNWQPGTNTVIVHVKSGAPSFPGWSGFLAQANQTINPVGVPLSVTATQTNVQCFGGNNGTASVSPSGGNGIYSYTWLPSGGSANVSTNLSAGNYSVIVSSSSCTHTQTFSITQASPVQLTVSPSATICQGSSASFSVSGAHTYSWNTGSVAQAITAANPGTYSVTGTNTLSGCSTSQTVSLTVDALPIVSVNGNTTICPGETTTLSASGANSYLWNPGNLTGSLINVSPLSTTIYTVVGTSTNGCSSNGTATITTNNTAAINIVSPSTVICIGGTTTLTANGASTYTWMPGNINSNSITVSPLASQTYSVLATMGSCTASAAQLVVVTPIPTVNISTNVSPLICSGSSIVLNASGASSFTWIPSNSNGNSITITPLIPVTYTVIGGAGSCTSQAVQEVTVSSSVDLQLTASSITVCAGSQVELEAQGASVITWFPGNFVGSTYTVQPEYSTTYTVIGNIGACSQVKTVSVNVSSVLADFTENSINQSNFDEVEFQNLSINNVQNFWYFSNGTTSMEVHPRMIFDEPGTYVACLLVKNALGCSDTLCKPIKIGCTDNAVFIPNSFTPNGDGLNDVFNMVALAQCLEKFELRVYDRWGEEIFHSDKPGESWDGTYKGKAVSEDVYIYQLQYALLNKKSSVKTGHITVIK
jgi:gliding motility-associated-like protein